MPRLTLRALLAGLGTSPGARLPYLDSAEVAEAAARDERFASLVQHEVTRLTAMWEHEAQAVAAYQGGATRSEACWVAGTDEVGRGPLAGPVVAAAVVFASPPGIPLLDDSKRLDPAAREQLVDLIKGRSRAWAICEVSPARIDEINIRQASLEAMRNALGALGLPLAHVLVDGNALVPGVEAPQTPLVKGDSRSLSIAAASVLAKVHRDRLMDELDLEHPPYGFASNRGYPTAAHLDAIAIHGVTRHHRASFAPVAARLAAQLELWS